MRRAMTREERNAHILRTARNLFIEKGYDEVTIQDVIRASDVARGTFYLHFNSLEEILITLFDHVVHETWARIAPILEQVEDIEECTIATVHAVFGMFLLKESDLAPVFFSGGGALFLKRREEALYGKLGGLLKSSLASRHHLLDKQDDESVDRILSWTVVMIINLVTNMAHYAVANVSRAEQGVFERQVVRFVLAGLREHMKELEES